MHGENGTPDTPEWQPNPGHTCGGCNATANLCYVLKQVNDESCCTACTHEPKTWHGDNA